MSGESLIDDVVRIVKDDSYEREFILDLLNKGHLEVAGVVLMPGLANGFDDVDTDPDENSVELPEDYHRNIYLATSNGVKLKIYSNIGIMLSDGYMGDMTAGSLLAVTVLAGNLFYQQVPVEATTISLRYYRKPALIADSTTSLLDSLEGTEQKSPDLEEALVSYAVKKIMREIEQGLEGAKVDTDFYEAKHKDAVARLIGGTEVARPRRAPPIVRTHY